MYRALFIERINHGHMRTAVSRSNDPALWFSPPSSWDVETLCETLQHSVSSLCPSCHGVVITKSPPVLPLLNLSWSQPALKAIGASTALLIQLKRYGVLFLMVKADVATIGDGKLAVRFRSRDRFIILLFSGLYYSLVKLFMLQNVDESSERLLDVALLASN